MNTRRLKSVLDGVTVLLVIGGAAVWLIDTEIPSPSQQYQPERSPATAGQSSPASLRNADDANAIVTANMFSATRAAPAVRYTPNAQGAADAGGAGAEPMLAPVAMPPRIYGTMTGPTGAMALIQPDSAGASGRIYQEGERVGLFRIEKILKSSVVLRGPSGRVEIPVEQREDRTQ